jgi:predicted HNH restriction endonuclease
LPDGFNPGKISLEDDEDFPEGGIKERRHKYRERNPRLVNMAKNLFVQKHKRLFCEVCGLDFKKVYREEGRWHIGS